MEFLLQKFLPKVDGLFPFFCGKPLTDLCLCSRRLDELQTSLAWPLIRRGHDFHGIAAPKFVLEWDESPVHLGACTMVTHLRMDTVSKVNWSRTRGNCLTSPLGVKM